jgi:hypothetical protein
MLCRDARHRLLEQTVGREFLAQRGAIDAEHGSSAALIAVVEREHLTQQRTFDFTNDQCVQTFIARRVADVREIAAYGATDALTQCALRRGFTNGLVGRQSDGVQGHFPSRTHATAALAVAMFMAVTAYAAGRQSRFLLREGSSVLAAGDKIKSPRIGKSITLCRTVTKRALFKAKIKSYGLPARVFHLEDQCGTCAS